MPTHSDVPSNENPFKKHFDTGQLIQYMGIELIVTGFTDNFTDAGLHSIQPEMHCDYVDFHGRIQNVSFKEQSFAAVAMFNNI